MLSGKQVKTDVLAPEANDGTLSLYSQLTHGIESLPYCLRSVQSNSRATRLAADQ